CNENESMVPSTSENRRIPALSFTCKLVSGEAALTSHAELHAIRRVAGERFQSVLGLIDLSRWGLIVADYFVASDLAAQNDSRTVFWIVNFSHRVLIITDYLIAGDFW